MTHLPHATPYTTPAGRRVRIRTRESGTYFAVVGEVLALNNRVIATTHPIPLGMVVAAEDAAKALADHLPRRR